MKNKWIILVGDIEDGVWTVTVNTDTEEVARSEYEKLKSDGTPTILIYTGDFVQV